MAQSITNEQLQLSGELTDLNLRVLAIIDVLPLAYPMLAKLITTVNSLLEETYDFSDQNLTRAQRLRGRVIDLLEGTLAEETTAAKSWFIAMKLVYEEMYSLVEPATERETETWQENSDFYQDPANSTALFT